MSISGANLSLMKNVAPLASPRFTKRYDSVTNEKADGATYTPKLLADFVASQIVQAHQPNKQQAIRVLDPAVGDGALLLSLLRELGHGSFQVFGFDTNASALRVAENRIRAEFPNAELNLIQEDFLQFVLESNHKDSIPSLFERNPVPQFDLIIANPPYVRTQIIGAQQAQELASSFGLSGRVDLYAAFLVGISQVLAPDGTAGVIVSNRFMTTKAGATVRAAVTSRFSLQHVWDLGDTKLFGAAVLPAVVLARGLSNHPSAVPAFSSIYETVDQAAALVPTPLDALAKAGVVAVADGRRFRVKHGKLDNGGVPEGTWRIGTSELDEWLATVDAHTWARFRDIGKVRVGVKTCADKVFIRRDWHELPENERPELLRPLTTHHVARRFRALKPKQDRAVLYPHTVEGGRRRAVDLAHYPRSRVYLEKHRSALESRTYVLEGGRRWYEIWVPQDPAAWSETKLVFRDISERPTFWIDTDGSIVNGDCYWMIAESDSGKELLWLAAAVANSSFIEHFYDHRFNNKLYAGRRRFITQYVEQFPLPNPKTAIGREIILLAKKVFSCVGTLAGDALEARLNALVWQAFGLPIEEAER